jgi:outer membrane biogenesis lipoprotein LolB
VKSLFIARACGFEVCALSLVLLALTGCASIAPASEAPSARSVGASANQPEPDETAFQLGAKVAVRAPQSNETFRLRWQRRGDLHRIEVLSPLGTTVAELFADVGYAELWRNKDEPPQSAESLDALLGQALSVNIDSMQLLAWLHGRLPAGTTITADNQAQFTVPNWSVQVAYIQSGTKSKRAERITITEVPAQVRATPEIGDTDRIRIRLVIDEYASLPSDAALLPTPHGKRP